MFGVSGKGKEGVPVYSYLLTAKSIYNLHDQVFTDVINTFPVYALCMLVWHRYFTEQITVAPLGHCNETTLYISG